MTIRRALSILTTMLLTILSLAAPAQTAAPKARDDRETVIVTGQRPPTTPDAIAHDVIRSVAAPSLLLGTIARWQDGLCPRTDGLSSRTLNNYVTRRIREIAAEAGAPLKDEPCKSNVEVMFTDDPQGVLDTVRQVNADILGYHAATTVSHPIQAWYETGTTDVRGQLVVDREVMGTIEYTNGGPTINPKTGAAEGFVSTFGIPMANIQGWKGRPEVSSDILGVFIIADSRQTGSHLLGPIADYVAMLALSRTDAYDACQIVPSIVNLMAPHCADALKPQAIAASDIAYLRGVYKMDPGATLQIQQDQIAGEMEKSLGGQ
jgi:hypothetical protein